MSAIRHVTLPAGFVAAGVKCGIKASGKEDLAIIAAESDAAAAILTTRNQVIGAPVVWCRQILPGGFGKIRGIVINAGCANVCTGKPGLKDAQTMAVLTAKLLGASPEKVLVASTGIIGHRLPMDKVRRGIADAASRLGTGNDELALRAIMTTDTREKSAVVQLTLGGKKVTLAGIVKGAGMIAPSVATMISVLTTDAAISPLALHMALKAAADHTFNAITIDSDTSTSDTVAVMASGKAGNTTITPSSRDYPAFAKALLEVCRELARAVVADGEGATKVLTVRVHGARNHADARTAAKTVANSPLFKCAVHGGDPNWGRILAALGRSSAKVDMDKTVIRIGGVAVFARGTQRKFNLSKVQAHLKGSDVLIDCDLGLGDGEFTALGCDLSRDYVTINADYHT